MIFMSFEQFCEEVCKKIVEAREGEGEIVVKDVIKNNGICQKALLFTKKGSCVSPTIYLNEYYEEYRRGNEMEGILAEILQIYRSASKSHQVDMDFFLSFDKVKDRICCKLIHLEKNEELLKNTPYVPYLDLAVVFYYAMENKILGNGSILIKENHCRSWQVTTEELFALAKENTKRLFPTEILSMRGMLEELVGQNDIIKAILDSEHIHMLVLTNKKRQFGAANILYTNKIKLLSDKLQRNLFILPSSVHEVIMIPDCGEKPGELQKMVSEVNAVQVAPEEFLSDSVYYYDRELECIRRMSYQ